MYSIFCNRLCKFMIISQQNGKIHDFFFFFWDLFPKCVIFFRDLLHKLAIINSKMAICAFFKTFLKMSDIFFFFRLIAWICVCFTADMHCCYIVVFVLTYFHLMKDCVTFFQPETIVESFSHLMVLFCKVNHTSKHQFVGLLC